MPLKVASFRRLRWSPVAVALLTIWALWCVFEVLVHRHPSLLHARNDRGSLGLASFMLAAAELCWLPHAFPLLRSLRAGRSARAFRRIVDSIIAVVVAVPLGIVGGFISVLLLLAACNGIGDVTGHEVLEWGRVDGLAETWSAVSGMLAIVLTAFATGGIVAASITAALAPRVGHYRYGILSRHVSAGCCGMLLAGTTTADHHPLVAGVCLVVASLFSLPWVRHPDAFVATS